MEKRKYPRKKNRFLVQLEGKDFQIYTNATDIGTGGAFINTLYLLSVGTPLQLKLQLPESEKTLDLEGKVIRQVAQGQTEANMENIGMAVEFTNLNQESRSAIQKLVQIQPN